ncbi:MAG: hypothetical protein V3V14_02360 [Saprospiraceae bacterium]
MANILDILSKTIEDVQRKNNNDPNVETADPSIFDLLRKEVNKIDKKVQNNQSRKGKNPKSIFDMIRDGIEGVQKKNRKDPNVKTAPKSIFDQLLKKIEKKPQKQASTGLVKVLQDYNLDVSGLPRQALQQIQQKYYEDLKKFNHQYASAIHKLVNQQRGGLF